MSDRKARLAALAAKAGRKKPEASQGDDAAKAQDDDVPQEQNDDEVQVKFRNYVPTTEEAPSKKRPRMNEDEKPSALQQALKKAQTEIPASETAAMGPKKINWDLKRDIQPKLDKLERRTQRAIVELLRQRLEQEAGQDEEMDDDDDSDLD